MIATALVVSPSVGFAEQPVFVMMPRWANGWGVQAQHEYQSFDDEAGHLLHLEGVYTWRRWIRLTYKIPWVIAAESAGTQTQSGLGTPVLALPLKKYFNRDGASGAWSLTPQVFLPISSSEFGRKDHWAGLSLSYAKETYRTATDLGFAGHLGAEGYPFEWHLHGGLGGKFYVSDTFWILRLRSDLRLNHEGEYSLRVEPVVYARLSDRWHAQMSWKVSVLSQGFDEGHWVRSGFGMVF